MCQLCWPTALCEKAGCGQRAYTIWVNIPIKGKLALCAHHDRELEHDLMADAWERALDARDELVAT